MRQTKAVINNPNTPLSPECISVLAKRLSFAPTYSANNKFQTCLSFIKICILKDGTIAIPIRMRALLQEVLIERMLYILDQNPHSFDIECFHQKKVTYEVDKLFAGPQRVKYHNLTKDESQALK